MRFVCVKVFIFIICIFVIKLQLNEIEANAEDKTATFGDGSVNRLYLNDQVDITGFASATAAHPEIEKIVKERTSFDNIKSIIYVPFTSLESMEYHVLNRIHKNWFFEALASSHVTFVYISNHIDDNAEVKKAKMEERIKNVLGYSTVQMTYTICRIPASIQLGEKWFTIFTTLFYCLDDKHPGPFTILSQSMYADPYDLQAVMDSVPASVNHPILTLENEAVISTGQIFATYHAEARNIFTGEAFIEQEIVKKKQANEGLLKSLREFYKTHFMVTSLNQAILQGVIKPIQDPKLTFGDYSSYPDYLGMLQRSQQLDNRHGIRSCSIKQESFSFQDIYSATLKTCSFIGNVRRDYEYHTLRYLQRLVRGKKYEIDWSDPQNQKEGRHCDLAIGITSRVPNMWERMNDRRTWGSLARSMGNVRVFYVYGQANTEISEHTKNQLEMERQYFKDVVILPTPEGYRMMFRKVAAWFGWAVENTNCEAIMKIDPDTYPRFFPMMRFLYKEKVLRIPQEPFDGALPREGVYFGMVNYNSHTWRQPDHPWYFYDKWPHDTLPPFMSGAIFGLTRNLAQHVYENREPDMRLDDPGVGAILAKLKEKDDGLVRYASADNWYPTKYRPDCVRDRIYENPFFSPRLDVPLSFYNDLFSALNCRSPSWQLVPLEELTSGDGDVELKTAPANIQLKPMDFQDFFEKFASTIRNVMKTLSPTPPPSSERKESKVSADSETTKSIKRDDLISPSSKELTKGNGVDITHQEVSSTEDIGKRRSSEGDMSQEYYAMTMFIMSWLSFTILALSFAFGRSRLKKKTTNANGNGNGNGNTTANV